jgi:predicted ATPase/DNA-binding SARP family transcriptional activator
MDVRWRIEMLGGLRVVMGDRIITRFRTQKTGALIAYLAYFPQRSHLRDALIELFWPDGDPSAGRNNLSRELAWLRQHLEPQGGLPGTVIDADRAAVRLNLDAVTTDVAAFDAALHAAERAASPAMRAQQLAAAIEGYRGELLPGYYDGWILQEREWLADRYFQALGQLLAHLEQSGEISRALEYARQGVRVDPLREESHRDLIRLLAAVGQPAAGLRQYRELQRLLKQELDAEPAAATQALARDVERLPDRSPQFLPSSPIPEPPKPVAPPHNLPLQLTRFVGREREMAEVNRLFASSHLVTLTGTGGGGKTRLALRVAGDLQEAFADGVWLVELAGLADPVLVSQTVASALGVREEPGRALIQTLSDYLRPKSLLLVLDNCEHLLSGCAQVAERLLKACSKLRILATSREGLQIAGETTYRVPSLSLPDPDKLPSVNLLPQFEAVRLFVDRAVAAVPAFALTAQNAAAVAQVCCRLDGLPLAIELAAVRVRALPVEQIAARLDDRFRLLTGGSRTALPRQQTLRAMVDWSYDLLSEEERALLRRLSVFAGGWSLEAAEGVCAGVGVAGEEVLDLLGRLVDKSLVLVEELEGASRYHLLETIRQYGAEKLQRSGEEAVWRGRHRDWFLGWAEAAAPQLRGAAQREWLARLEGEHDNLRAALAWCTERGDAEAGLRLGGPLSRFWAVRGYFSEGRERFAKLLSLPGAEKLLGARAEALRGAGWLARLQGDTQSARVLFEESETICRQLDDQHGIAQSLNNLGVVAGHQGEFEAARGLYEESLAIQRQLGDQHGIAASLHNLGMIALDQGEYEAARALHEESLAIQRELGNQQGIAASLSSLGNVARLRGEYEAARGFSEQSLAICRQLGDQRAIAILIGNLAKVACGQEDYVGARALRQESLTLFRQLGDQQGIAWSLEGAAAIAGAQNQPERGARLFGASEGLRGAIGSPLSPSERADCERHVAAARAALGEEAFAAAWEAGRAMSLDDAVTLALDETQEG